MLKTVEDISATKKRLSIEIPSEAIEKEIMSSLDYLRKKTRLPGFRPGRAPMALIEKRFGKDVEAEALDKVIPAFYSEALKEADIRPVTQPSIEGGVDFKRNSPLSLTLTVEVRPEIEGLDYEGLKVRDIPADVEDSDVEGTLGKLRQDRAVYEPSGGPVKEGDLVVMDYEIKGRNEPSRDQVFMVGSEQMPREFSDRLIGMDKGREEEFEVTFPDGFRLEELAGKKETLRVSVKEVKNVTLPALDDEFAKDLEFDDMDSLKAHIRQRLEKSKKEAVANMLKAEIMKKLLDAHDFDAPVSLVEEQLGHLLAQARAQGGQEDDETLRKELLPEAGRNVKASLLIQAIGEKEGIKATEEDVKERAVSLSGRLGLSPENVIKYYVSRDGSLEGLKHSIYEDKVLDLLLERAEVEEAEKGAKT